MKRTLPVALALALCGALSLALSASAERYTSPTVKGARPAASSPLPQTAARQSRASRRALEDFDVRADHQPLLESPPETTSSGAKQPSISAAQSFRLLRDYPRARVRWSSLTGTPSRLLNYQGPLSPASQDDAEVLARRFLKQNNDLFRLGDGEVDGLRVARRDHTEHNGVTHLTLEQRVGGIEVFHAQLAMHFDRQGALIAATGELLPGVARAVNLTQPRLTAADALRRAAGYVEAEISGAITPRAPAAGAEQKQEFDKAAGFARDVPARLVYFPVSADQVQLAWELILWMTDTPEVYFMLIDAEDGSLLFRHNLTWYDENPLKPHGPVFTGDSPRPNIPYAGVNSPSFVEREDLPFHAVPFNGSNTFAVADKHYDWWAGAAATGLISNNTDAHLDRDANNQPDLPRLTAADGNFSFPVDFTQQPTTDNNQKAAQVNLFYWTNRYHDILYSFGFTEAAGNFQTDNFGLGGQGNDAIQADAQDGSGTNNANFSSPPDGNAGRVQMFLWTTANPQLDGDFDQDVILHELTHGLSTRLVGNSTGLLSIHGGGMGEGWSDYFGLVLLLKESDDVDGSYPVGQYVTNAYGRGVRRFPYSTDLNVNPLTFGNISLSTEVHNVGEIWCNTLLEMRALLIKQYGFREGQRLSLQLVVDGLKLTPIGPTFIDARDAILLADRVDTRGANQCLIWQAFAKRGESYLASAFYAGDGTPYEGFEATPYCVDTGSIRLDKRNYIVGETLRITLGDHNAVAPVRVQVTSSKTGDQETVTLTPDAVFPGSFSGTVRLAAGIAKPGDGLLQSSDVSGDQVTVSYQDGSGSGGGPVSVQATAGVTREKAVFEDDVEHGNQGWIASGNWAITSTRSGSSTRSWTDSPNGALVNSSDTSLTSQLFDFTGLSDVVLTISQSYDLSRGRDVAFVEYSIDDGATWIRAASFSGSQATFAQSRVNLDGLSGQPRARIRFHLLAGATATIRDGWYIDDIRLLARSANPGVIRPGSAQAPVIAAVSPAFGSPAGGTRVAITGFNFTESSDTTVTFDGIPATGVNVLGGSTIVAVAPPHAAGPVTVRVINYNGVAAIGNGFTYFVAGSSTSTPTLARIFPASGITRGGTVITLVGTNFTPETRITFGDRQAASVTFVNANTLRAVAPAAAATGAVDVIASNGTNRATLTGAFNYTAPTPPLVQVLSPGSGETFFTGADVVIRWKSSDDRAVASHRIALYRSAGPQLPAFIFVADISTNVAGEAQSFIWRVPANIPLTDLARIRVTAVDDEGTETEAFSSSDFIIARRWEARAPLPTALQRHAVVSDGRFIYSIGGRTTNQNGTTVATLQRYDPATDAWTSQGLAPLPTAFNGAKAVFLNGKIYVPGGIDPTGATVNVHYVYDVAANTWSTLAPPPLLNPPAPFPANSGLALYSLAADEARGVYYVTGGAIEMGNTTLLTSAAKMYDPRSNTWSSLPVMRAARFGHQSVVIGGKLYVAGGLSISNPTGAEVFDFDTRQWSQIASLSRPREQAISTLAIHPAGRLIWYLVGGDDFNTGTLLGVEAYDITADRWFTLDNSFNLGTSRTLLGGASVGGFFYAVGGGVTTTASNTANERLRFDGLLPAGPDQPPLVVVPAAQVAVANTELKFSVTATDLGSPLPITITASGLPESASFTLTSGSNNSVRGTFRWTPAAGDVGKVFNLTFTASDGQLSDSKVVVVRVVQASPLAVVNAAHYRSGPLALDSVVAAFGTNLAVRTEVAQAQPLPFELAGTTVTVNGVPAPLFFVSPSQINFAVPSSLDAGPATVIVSSPLGTYALGTVNIVAASPALFTADASGTGDASALATVDGINYQLPPFDVTVNGKPNILVLYGTGFRHAEATNPNDDNGVAESVRVTIGGQTARVLFAGAQGQFAGLDQINVEIPSSLAGSGPRRVEVVVSLNGVEANRVTILIK